MTTGGGPARLEAMVTLYSVEVPQGWTDHYGHMNEGYYVVAASEASWALQAHLGIGTDYFDRTGCALVTVESHIRYLAEVQRGETLAFDSLVLGFDARRLHMAHLFRVGARACGSIECMWLHVDSHAGRSVAMPDEVQAALAAIVADELPPWAGRRVALKRGP